MGVSTDAGGGGFPNPNDRTEEPSVVLNGRFVPSVDDMDEEDVYHLRGILNCARSCSSGSGRLDQSVGQESVAWIAEHSSRPSWE